MKKTVRMDEARDLMIDGGENGGDGGFEEAGGKAFCFELCWLALHTLCSACLTYISCACNAPKIMND